MKLVAHSDRVFSIPSFLDAGECLNLITIAETVGFTSARVRTAGGQTAMPAIRNNERVMVENREWVEALWRGLSSAGLP